MLFMSLLNQRKKCIESIDIVKMFKSNIHRFLFEFFSKFTLKKKKSYFVWKSKFIDCSSKNDVIFFQFKRMHYEKTWMQEMIFNCFQFVILIESEMM